MSARRSSAPLRLGFAGTPEFATIILRGLLDHEHTVAVVYTQPDRPAGRGRRLQPSPVKVLAMERQLTIRQPVSLRGETAASDLAACKLDILVVAAYGLILPQQILSIPGRGCINVHASLLPRWRGAAPIERAIMAGDEQTGISIMQMDAGLDTGPVLAQARCAIDPDTTGPDLDSKLAHLGSQYLLECLSDLASFSPRPQGDGGATYADKLTAADAHINWLQAAQHIHRQVRALCGRQPATARVGDLRIQILAADWQADPTDAAPGTVIMTDRQGIQIACGVGSIIVRQLRLNRGKGRPLPAADAINGYPELFAVGALLADPS